METSSSQHETVPRKDDVPFLPDDVVLQVFKHLTVKELLAARLSCQRWAQLALHRDAWKGRDVSDSKEDVFEAALHLAPCARSLRVRRLTVAPRLAVLAVTTRCAVEKLDIDSSDALTVACAVRNQVLLGRLRTLTLGIAVHYPLRERSRELISAVCAISGLTDLCLSITATGCEGKWPPWQPPTRRPEPSLKKLTVKLEPGWAEYVSGGAIARHLVACHAATLEVLLLPNLYDAPTDAGQPLAEALAAAANLRHLECPPPRGVAALLQCAKLDTLCLRLDTVSLGDDYLVASDSELKDFLRRAPQLRHLTLAKGMFFSDYDLDFALSDVVQLAEAVASSRRSALSVLDMRFVWDGRATQYEGPDSLLSVLADGLGHLAALREVRAAVGDDEGLLGLMGRVGRVCAARAITLRVTAEWGLHELVHDSEARMAELFLTCPTLHVEFEIKPPLNSSDYFYGSPHRRPISCGECVFGRLCLDGGDKTNSTLVLFGHPEGDDYECDAPQHTDASAACHRLTRDDASHGSLPSSSN